MGNAEDSVVKDNIEYAVGDYRKYDTETCITTKGIIWWRKYKDINDDICNGVYNVVVGVVRKSLGHESMNNMGVGATIRKKIDDVIKNVAIKKKINNAIKDIALNQKGRI